MIRMFVRSKSTTTRHGARRTATSMTNAAGWAYGVRRSIAPSTMATMSPRTMTLIRPMWLKPSPGHRTRPVGSIESTGKRSLASSSATDNMRELYGCARQEVAAQWLEEVPVAAAAHIVPIIPATTCLNSSMEEMTWHQQ